MIDSSGSDAGERVRLEVLATEAREGLRQTLELVRKLPVVELAIILGVIGAVLFVIFAMPAIV